MEFFTDREVNEVNAYIIGRNEWSSYSEQELESRPMSLGRHRQTQGDERRDDDYGRVRYASSFSSSGLV